MMPIYWTTSARTDLRAIYAYIARDSSIYARRMMSRIKSKVERLKRFPESGSGVEEWDRDDIREIYVGNYRVIHRVFPDRVEILTVIHGAQRLPRLGI
jgi:toxin ParE1/3/4